MNSRSGSVTTLVPDPSERDDAMSISCRTSDAGMKNVSSDRREMSIGISGVRLLVKAAQSCRCTINEIQTNLAGKPHVTHFSRHVKADWTSVAAAFRSVAELVTACSNNGTASRRL